MTIKLPKYHLFNSSAPVITSTGELSHYTPNTQAAMDNTSGRVNGYNPSSAEIIAKWDELVANFPDNVTKTLLGQDEGGINLYYYTFTPTGNTQKIKGIIQVGIHWEFATHVWTIWNLFNEIYTNHASDSALSQMYADVQWIVVPLLNASRFDAWSTDPASQGTTGVDFKKNYNGVEPNRNSDNNWDAYVQDGVDKGTAPWSESEIAAMRDLLIANSDAYVFLDFHTEYIYGEPWRYAYFAGDRCNKNSLYGSNSAVSYCNSVYPAQQRNKSYTYSAGTSTPKVLAWADAFTAIPFVGGCELSTGTETGKPNINVFTSELATKYLQWYGDFIYQQIKSAIIQKAYDDTLWTPDEDLNVAEWNAAWKATSVVCAKSKVSQWSGQNSANLTQSDASFQPIYSGNYRAIKFDSDYMLYSSGISAKAGLFAVSNVNGQFGGTTTSVLCAIGGGSSFISLRPNSSDYSVSVDGFAAADSGDASINGGALTPGNGTGTNIAIDGYTGFPTRNYADLVYWQINTARAWNTIGRVNHDDNNVKAWIHGYILWADTPSEANRQKAEGYFAWQTGAQAKLPIGHPYKDSPPFKSYL